MKRLLLPLILVLLATSCAAPASSPGPAEGPASVAPEASPEPSAMPAGEFKLTTEAGAEITFTLPTPPTDPAVKDIEAFRVKAGADPVSYLVADVDNRKGMERVNMYQVSAFDEDGRQYTFSSVADLISDWGPSYGSDYKYTLPNGKVLDDAAGDALSREATKLHNANIGDADVAERASLILASTDADLPKEFTRVSVQPSGGGEGEEATSAS